VRRLAILDEPFLDVTAELRQRHITQGAGDFGGRWDQRHPLGIPGPIYVGDDDSCGTGPEAAPNNVFDQRGEFLFRQPSTVYELRQVLCAAEENACSAYAIDGDSHWTPASVEAWGHWLQAERRRLHAIVALSRAAHAAYWQESERVRASAEATGVAQPLPPLPVAPAGGFWRWLDYLDHGAEAYLARYAAFLKRTR